jgi:hypothetical protein
MTIDAWMQHPTQRFLDQEMFASLRRWTGQVSPGQEIPVAATVAAMDQGGVGFGLLSAWHGLREGALISICRKHENVHIDTSAYTTERLPAELVGYMKTGGGRHKVLFGTNYPMIFHAKALEGLAALGLEEETRDLYLEGNARRVFGLP